jgi:hypothetical protein
MEIAMVRLDGANARIAPQRRENELLRACSAHAHEFCASTQQWNRLGSQDFQAVRLRKFATKRLRLVLVKEYKQLTRNGEGQRQTGRHALEAMGKRCEVVRASGNVRKRNITGCLAHLTDAHHCGALMPTFPPLGYMTVPAGKARLMPAEVHSRLDGAENGRPRRRSQRDGRLRERLRLVRATACTRKAATRRGTCSSGGKTDARGMGSSHLNPAINPARQDNADDIPTFRQFAQLHVLGAAESANRIL